MNPIFQLHEYNSSGQLIGQRDIRTSDLDSETLNFFQRKLARLSHDLELPLESVLPGELPFLEFRIGSDGSAAYVLYYFHDEVLMASLILPGGDEQAEEELIDVFRFLLLDAEDSDEPTEEEIEQVLGSELFDFRNIQRPAVINISFASDPSDSPELDYVSKMNLHLAKAFCDKIERRS